MSERIVNGACTTCKGDAYLFYDAAGGHCWKCAVAAAEARAVRAEGERDEFKMHRDTDYAAYQEHLDSAAKDSARLDWVQSHRGCVGHHLDTNRWYSRAGCKFTTVRDAIDAAIAAERP